MKASRANGGRRRSKLTLIFCSALACLLLAAPSAFGAFEIPNFEARGLQEDGTPSVGAGERPREIVNDFDVNLIPGLPPNLPLPAGNVKDVISELPPGFVGNAAAFPQCPHEQMDAASVACPIASQVGYARLKLRWGSLAAGNQTWTVPIFNMEPAPGTAAQFAFRTTAAITYVDFHVRTGSDYGVTAVVHNINETAPVMVSDLTVWGVPGDPSNDDFRVDSAGGVPGETVTPYPEPPPYKVLLSNPTSCGTPEVSRMSATSWQHPDVAVSATPDVAPAMQGCNAVDFQPRVEAKATTNQGDSPSGFEFHLHIPQNQDASGRAVAQLKDSTVTLPPSLTVNPSSANGLGACTIQQIGYLGTGGEKQVIRYDKQLADTFAVSYGGATTAAIPAGGTASQVAQALETLPGLAGNVSVSGAPGGWIVTFGGALAGVDVPTLQGTVSNKPSQTLAVTGTGGGFNLESGGDSTAATFEASFAEGASEFIFASNISRVPKVGEIVVGPGIAPGTTLSSVTAFPEFNFAFINLSNPTNEKEPPVDGDPPVQLHTLMPFDASTGQIQESLEGLPTIGDGNIAVTGPAISGSTRSFTVIATGSLAGTEPVITGVSELTGEGAGVTISPGPSSGSLQVDTFEQAGTPQFTPDAANCPDDAKLGSVRIDSPAVIDHPLQGTVYLAAQNENPFNSLLAIYITVDDPQSGVVVKLPGKIEADQKTGQLTATVADAPQLPFEDLSLEFFKGAGAPLKTGIACEKSQVKTDMVPWSSPEGATQHPSDSFTVNQGCSASEAQAPKTLNFQAGTADPVAGDFSPFTLRVSRPDGSQQLTGIDTVLPKGLLAKLAGTPYCPDAALAAAAGKAGKAEQASPSCPAASKVGSVTVGAGAGPKPFYAGGEAYLAGPYKGAPVSLAVITPAVAGPFDLGTVVVRTALRIDPETAIVHAVSDPFPTILQGIPLDLRSIVLRLDKPQFTKNPTSCAPQAITGALTTLPGQSLDLNQRFQVGECKRLGFKPALALSLKGGTKRAQHPALKAVLTMPKQEGANIAFASVALPHSEFLAQNHIKTICTRVQFNAGAGNGAECPKASIYGKATAVTPLLGQPLSGPVYLRSSNHPLPDLVAALNGQIDIALVGRIDSQKGGLRTTFESVPDAPVSKFTLQMQGGKKGLLENSRNLCKSKNRATVIFDAQNGRSSELAPALKSKCRKARKGKKHGHHRS